MADRNPFAEGFRTFTVIVTGRTPTAREVIDGLGPAVTMWDGPEAVDIKPAAGGHRVTLIAKIEGMPAAGKLVEGTPVNLGHIHLPEVPSIEPKRPDAGNVLVSSAPVNPLYEAYKRGDINPYDSSTWPEGYKVEWREGSASPEDAAAFVAGWTEELEPKVIGEIPAGTDLDKLK